jgi:hypothetical protein
MCYVLSTYSFIDKKKPGKNIIYVYMFAVTIKKKCVAYSLVNYFLF